MAVSGSQIVFPSLEHASFHCGHCTAPVFLCACSGVGHGKDYVLMGCGLLHHACALTSCTACNQSIRQAVRSKHVLKTMM